MANNVCYSTSANCLFLCLHQYKHWDVVKERWEHAMWPTNTVARQSTKNISKE